MISTTDPRTALIPSQVADIEYTTDADFFADLTVSYSEIESLFFEFEHQ